MFTGKQNDTTAVCNRDTGRNIRIEKQFFYRSGVRVKQLNQLLKIGLDPVQA